MGGVEAASLCKGSNNNEIMNIIITNELVPAGLDVVGERDALKVGQLGNNEAESEGPGRNLMRGNARLHRQAAKGRPRGENRERQKKQDLDMELKKRKIPIKFRGEFVGKGVIE